MIPKYKDIVDLIKKGATIEAQKKIMNLREAALELQEENVDLKSHIKKLEEELKIKESLEYSRSCYWLWKENDAGDFTIKDGPFCQRCYDVEQKLIRLQDWGEVWMCMSCEKTYEKQVG